MEIMARSSILGGIISIQFEVTNILVCWRIFRIWHNSIQFLLLTNSVNLTSSCGAKCCQLIWHLGSKKVARKCQQKDKSLSLMRIPRIVQSIISKQISGVNIVATISLIKESRMQTIGQRGSDFCSLQVQVRTWVTHLKLFLK